LGDAAKNPTIVVFCLNHDKWDIFEYKSPCYYYLADKIAYISSEKPLQMMLK
jgi:hypothetical protein